MAEVILNCLVFHLDFEQLFIKSHKSFLLNDFFVLKSLKTRSSRNLLNVLGGNQTCVCNIRDLTSITGVLPFRLDTQVMVITL